MLKEYIERDDDNKPKPVLISISVTDSHNCDKNRETEDQKFAHDIKLKNSDCLANLDVKLGHLSTERQEQLKSLILEFKHLFPDTPGKTDKVCHDVDVNDAAPIKQHPYRINPVKLKHFQSEVD